jgi:hypothetical protein
MRWWKTCQSRRRCSPSRKCCPYSIRTRCELRDAPQWEHEQPCLFNHQLSAPLVQHSKDTSRGTSGPRQSSGRGGVPLRSTAGVMGPHRVGRRLS